MTLPPLPDNLPNDLREFIECRNDTATIANGPLTWVQIPADARALLGGNAQPDLSIVPGPAPGSAVIDIRVGWVQLRLPAAVSDGKLAIDTSRLPFWAPGSVKADVTRFVDALNDRLAANGKRLDQPTFGDDGMTLTKVALAPAGDEPPAA